MSELDAFLQRLAQRPQGIIYLARNNVTGDEYIGATTRQLRDRWKQHRKDKNKAGSPFHKALREYTATAFTIEQIASCLSLKDLGKLEQEIIQQRKPTYNRSEDITVWSMKSGKMQVRNLPSFMEPLL
jgi:hypothetical protein